MPPRTACRLLVTFNDEPRSDRLCSVICGRQWGQVLLWSMAGSLAVAALAVKEVDKALATPPPVSLICVVGEIVRQFPCRHQISPFSWA